VILLPCVLALNVLVSSGSLVDGLSGRVPVAGDRTAALRAPLSESSQSATAAQMRIPLSHTVDFFVGELEKQLIDAADAMPQWKYPFVPTVGEFKGVRTFGEQVKHLAATNYILAAAALREPAPADAGDETGPSALYMKSDILDYLKGSFRALHRAAAAIDDSNALIPNTPISPLIGQATRLGYVQEALIHIYDHYGQMVIYLRMNGIIPPASR
jgi:DinB superfamily